MQDEQNNPQNNQVPQDAGAVPQPPADVPATDDQGALNVDHAAAPADPVSPAPAAPVDPAVAPEAPAPVEAAPAEDATPAAPADGTQDAAPQDPASGAL